MSVDQIQNIKVKIKAGLWYFWEFTLQDHLYNTRMYNTDCYDEPSSQFAWIYPALVWFFPEKYMFMVFKFFFSQDLCILDPEIPEWKFQGQKLLKSKKAGKF